MCSPELLCQLAIRPIRERLGKLLLRVLAAELQDSSSGDLENPLIKKIVLPPAWSKNYFCVKLYEELFFSHQSFWIFTFFE